MQFVFEHHFGNRTPTGLDGYLGSRFLFVFSIGMAGPTCSRPACGSPRQISYTSATADASFASPRRIPDCRRFCH